MRSKNFEYWHVPCVGEPHRAGTTVACRLLDTWYPRCYWIATCHWQFFRTEHAHQPRYCIWPPCGTTTSLHAFSRKHRLWPRLSYGTPQHQLWHPPRLWSHQFQSRASSDVVSLCWSFSGEAPETHFTVKSVDQPRPSANGQHHDFRHSWFVEYAWRSRKLIVTILVGKRAADLAILHHKKTTSRHRERRCSSQWTELIWCRSGIERRTPDLFCGVG